MDEEPAGPHSTCKQAKRNNAETETRSNVKSVLCNDKAKFN
jgi:hypothetical protein